MCTACCFLINCLSWGVVAVRRPHLEEKKMRADSQKSYGVYLAYYVRSGTFDASPSSYSFVGGLIFAAAMAVTPLVSLLSARFGARLPMLLGAVLFGGGFIAASFATAFWHLLLAQGACVGCGVGFLYLPSINILPQWFDKRRSLASAVSAAGSGIGGLIFSLSTGKMIDSLGLGWALRITGIVTLFVNLAAVSLVRDRDEFVKPSYAIFDWRLLKRLDVLLLLAWAFVMLFGYIIIQFSLSDFARSLGLSQSQADLVTALLNVGTALGRPCIGYLSDRFGRIEVATMLTLVSGLFCLAMWIPSQSLGVTAAFALLVGGPYGVFWAVSFAHDISVLPR